MASRIQLYLGGRCSMREGLVLVVCFWSLARNAGGEGIGESSRRSPRCEQYFVDFQMHVHVNLDLGVRLPVGGGFVLPVCLRPLAQSARGKSAGKPGRGHLGSKGPYLCVLLGG